MRACMNSIKAMQDSERARERERERNRWKSHAALLMSHGMHCPVVKKNVDETNFRFRKYDCQTKPSG